MNPTIAGLPAGPLVPPVPAHDRPGIGSGWLLQLQRANAAGATPTPLQMPAARARTDASSESEGLEPCGMPCGGAPSVALVAAGTPVPDGPLAAAAADHAIPNPSPEVASPRIHIEHDAQGGLRVWLGLAANDPLLARRCEAAVAELRRALAAGGQQLSTLVCNGSTVYASALRAASAPARNSPGEREALAPPSHSDFKETR